MAGKIKKLQRAEGTAVALPSELMLDAGALKTYASDAAYVTAKGSAAVDGDAYYNTTTDTARLYAADAWTDLGSGSGTGINYMTNGDFEKTTVDTQPAGWELYVDAAAINPVDGTGDSGSADISFLANATTPLRDNLDGRIYKSPGTATQGEGISFDFALDKADYASVIKVSFDYRATSAFDYGTNGSATNPSDVTIWIYDVDESTLIQLTPYTLDGSGKFEGYFQSHATSVNYRLILHLSVPDAHTNSWSLYLDNVVVGPSVHAHGPAMTDWTAFTPIFSTTVGDGTYSLSGNVGRWRRVGDSIEIIASTSFSGVTAAPTGTLTVSLPTGLNLDTVKCISSNGVKGFARYYDNGVGDIPASVRYYSGSSPTNVVGISTASTVAIPSMATSDQVHVWFSAPISGWSSNTLVSSDADTRVVALMVTDSGPTHAFSSGFSVVKLDNPAIYNDTHSSYSTATGGYTIPVSGYYNVAAGFVIGDSANWTADEVIVIAIGINATNASTYRSLRSSGGGESYLETSINLPAVKLNAGDVIYPLLLDTGTTADHAFEAVDDYNFFSIARVSGPASIAASEVVAARAKITANSVAIASSATFADQVIDFDTVDYDTHGAISGSGTSWKFTAPISGKYSVTFSYMTAAVTLANGEVLESWIGLNGSGVHYLDYFRNPVTMAASYEIFRPGLHTEIALDAGDYIQIALRETHSAAAYFNNADTGTFVEIHRIGGVM